MIGNIAKHLLKGGAAFGAAYVGSKALNYGADLLEEGKTLSHGAGPAITGLMRLGGSALTLGAGVGVGIRTAGGLINNKRMQGFSSTKLAGELLFRGKRVTGSANKIGEFTPLKRDFKIPSLMGLAGKGARSVGVGLAKMPLAMARDVAKVTGISRVKGFKKFDNYVGESLGGRFFGWGALAGAGALAVSINGVPGERSTYARSYRDRPIGEPAMALAGSQTYDPTRATRPRSDNMETASLVQSLHLLRHRR